jgi:hypothetical protein
MHAINDRPVAVNGQVVIRPIMIVALTYDHRLLDGREAVTFLGTLLLYYSIESSPLTRSLFFFFYSESQAISRGPSKDAPYRANLLMSITNITKHNHVRSI